MKFVLVSIAAAFVLLACHMPASTATQAGSGEETGTRVDLAIVVKAAGAAAIMIAATVGAAVGN